MRNCNRRLFMRVPLSNGEVILRNYNDSHSDDRFGHFLNESIKFQIITQP